MTHELNETNVRWFMDEMLNIARELEGAQDLDVDDMSEEEAMQKIAELEIGNVKLQVLSQTYAILTQDMEEDYLREIANEYQDKYDNDSSE